MRKTFKQSRDEVEKLCQYFLTNQQEFLSPRVKEAHVRQSLIDPFFETLGWDVGNIEQVAPQYREVIPEDSLDVEGQQKAPDYCFRVGTMPKFYAEAKKCGININADPGPAYQLRRYGWSAKVVLSILTDFEELGVYDCTIRPRPNDKASYARIQYFRFEEYIDRWREIWDVFSREAVWSGAFDKFAASKRKRGTSEVDVEFLKEIESWRDVLARNIALRNKELSSDDLNAAVQLTIDRVVFLRMAEDRGIESYEQLLKLCERSDIYTRFIKDLCFRADEKYNSGLFHFHEEKGVSEMPDRITPKLVIDDKVFKPILQNLYFAHGSPYHFGVLPVEILGTVYEQFLGKVIRLTAGHHAKIEEKPEVRKAGGVYYTPAYIVDFIVKHTVGMQIEGKSPQQLAGSKNRAPFRVLDMACGSGSFLLGAYQCLLDHCIKWYMEHTPKKYKKAVYQDGRNGQWRLTIEEKKRVLTTHIFGVDIDPQAVEVSKLSLLLKVLEGETDQSIGQQMKLFKERALPNLAENIKCGNSLIGPEYFTGTLIPHPEEMRRVNPFDWTQGFPDAMKVGGFDCIIGNPPWGAYFSDDIKPYLRAQYMLHSGKYESYFYFVEKATNILTDTGAFGYIIPSYWISRFQTKSLREHFFGILWPRGFILLPENVFKGVKMDSCIIIAGKQEPKAIQACEITKGDLPKLSTADLTTRCIPIPFNTWKENPKLRFNPRITGRDSALLAKLSIGTIPFGSIVEITQGLTLYRRSSLVKMYGKARAEEIVSQRLFHCNKKKDHTYKKELLGRDVDRYFVKWNEKSWVSYGPWLAHAVHPRFFTGPRIVIQKLRNPVLRQRLVAGYLDDNDTYSAGVLLNAIPGLDTPYSLLYLLGILNSKAINYWYRKSVLDVSIRVVDLAKVPIRAIDFSSKANNSIHDRMVQLVDSMLTLHKQLVAAESSAQKEVIQRQIVAMDAEIDHLVYELYGLTKEEIALIEGER